jgi:hypothetical protein
MLRSRSGFKHRCTFDKDLSNAATTTNIKEVLKRRLKLIEQILILYGLNLEVWELEELSYEDFELRHEISRLDRR